MAKTIAVMQPYVFPYLGYYQLVNAVETFVFFDDVNFIMKGWINRNQILQNNEPFKFSIPLTKASQNKLINELMIADYPAWKSEFLKKIEQGYKKAPHFEKIYTWLCSFLSIGYTHIGELAIESIQQISILLSIPTTFQRASSIDYDRVAAQTGQQKILNICGRLSASSYINPINGMDLYEPTGFSEKGVSLAFIKKDAIQYEQFGEREFLPHLSIIDVLMFNGLDQTKLLLKKYSLITNTP